MDAPTAINWKLMAGTQRVYLQGYLGRSLVGLKRRSNPRTVRIIPIIANGTTFVKAPLGIASAIRNLCGPLSVGMK